MRHEVVLVRMVLSHDGLRSLSNFAEVAAYSSQRLRHELAALHTRDAEDDARRRAAIGLHAPTASLVVNELHS